MICFRPRLRFSLRTLFVLVTLLCVWLGYHLNWIRERHAVLKELFFSAEYEIPGPNRLPLALRVLGEDRVNSIHLIVLDSSTESWMPPEKQIHSGLCREAQVERISGLFPEARIFIRQLDAAEWRELREYPPRNDGH